MNKILGYLLSIIAIIVIITVIEPFANVYDGADVFTKIGHRVLWMVIGAFAWHN